MPKDPLPTLGDDPLTGRGYDALEGVEQAILSGVDHVDHNGAQSLFQDMVKSIVAFYESQEKNGHNFIFFINLCRKLSSENFCRKRQS